MVEEGGEAGNGVMEDGGAVDGRWHGGRCDGKCSGNKFRRGILVLGWHG